LEAGNKQPITLSIFGIQKLLKCAVGEVNTLKMNTWISTSTKVTPHKSLNSCKGVICCRNLRDCSDEKVLEALSKKSVTEVKHIFAKKNGSSLLTNTFILTFDKPILPKSVKVAYLNVSVEPFVPIPLRCYNWQKFDHGKSACGA
jgi:hypothetical protein